MYPCSTEAPAFYRKIVRRPVAPGGDCSWLYAALRARNIATALFESKSSPESARYSILAIDPVGRFSVSREDGDRSWERFSKELQGAKFTGETEQDIPFIGGWAGFFSYDLSRYNESIPSLAAIDDNFPLIDLTFYRSVLTHDRLAGSWSLSTLVGDEESDGSAEARLDGLAGEIESLAYSPITGNAMNGRMQSDFTREQYLRAVERCLDYIAAGDIYQVNISQRFCGRLEIPAYELARRLFASSHSSFCACYESNGRAVISASPERFLKIGGRSLTTWPIKGTRPRSSDPGEDRRMLQQLLSSEKERAELTMITDLLRNDLGRVAEYGSVEVRNPRLLESFSHVHHTRSEVCATLREGVGLAALLRSMTPGGSVTGAPKIRACEIIEELEPVARGPYCGSVGYIGLDGRADLNIAIRTLLVDDGRITFNVGGGIVADSVPSDEYDETLHKARELFRVLNAPAAECSEK